MLFGQAAHRLLGSFCRHERMKSSKVLEYLCALPVRSSVGGSSCSVFMSTLTGARREYGARPCVSSRAVMPNDQMSAEGRPVSYSLS